MSAIKIKWLAEDGYVGGERPHYVVLKPEHFDVDQTDEQIEDQIRHTIREDFEQSVTVSYSDDAVSDAVEKIRAALIASAAVE